MCSLCRAARGWWWCLVPPPPPEPDNWRAFAHASAHQEHDRQAGPLESRLQTDYMQSTTFQESWEQLCSAVQKQRVPFCSAVSSLCNSLLLKADTDGARGPSKVGEHEVCRKWQKQGCQQACQRGVCLQRSVERESSWRESRGRIPNGLEGIPSEEGRRPSASLLHSER